MTIVHHLDDATILSYAAGTLGEALSVAAACHISMCAECRTAVRNAEALGGEILDDLEATAVSDARRAATLASLDDKRTARPTVVKSDMPAPLQRLLQGQDFAQLRWRKKAPGVSVYELPLSKGAKGSLKLLSIASGMTMLEHGHGGEELTLVLQGAFKDKVGRFARGDIADLDEDTEHCPILRKAKPAFAFMPRKRPRITRHFWVACCSHF